MIEHSFPRLPVVSRNTEAGNFSTSLSHALLSCTVSSRRVIIEHQKAMPSHPAALLRQEDSRVCGSWCFQSDTCAYPHFLGCQQPHIPPLMQCFTICPSRTFTLLFRETHGLLTRILSFPASIDLLPTTFS